MLKLSSFTRRLQVTAALSILALGAVIGTSTAANAAPSPAPKATPAGKKSSGPVDDVGMYTLPISTDTSKKIDESTLSPEQKAVLKRSQERWLGLIEFDLPKVYSFATPAYRKTHDQRHLNGQYAMQISRNRAEAQEIKIAADDPNTAKVTTLLFITSRALAGAAGIELSSWQHETWVKVDGQWWFVEPK